MYPILFSIGHFDVATYGVVVALAFLAAGTLAARGFRDRGLDPDYAWTLLFYGLIGGFLGAKIYFALINGPGALLSRSGFVWYGGFIGGAAAVAWAIRRKRLPLALTADALAPALALGHGIGHIACFFSGDSYGVPSNLPWAVAFARGAPPSTAGNLRRAFGVDVPASIPDDVLLSVHPTMLYSAAALLAIAGFLWLYRRRSGLPGRLFAIYLILASVERFLVEFVRAKDDRLLWGATTAQAVAVTLMVLGVVLLVRYAQAGRDQLRSSPRESPAGG
ncbi:MAG: prolipoprotein diacylglyceryl transferase [Longimicrobiales bacterium]